MRQKPRDRGQRAMMLRLAQLERDARRRRTWMWIAMVLFVMSLIFGALFVQ